MNDGSTLTATATCSGATPKLLSGGYRLTTDGPASDLKLLNPTENYPSAAGTWTATITVDGTLPNGGGPITITLTAYAVCSA